MMDRRRFLLTSLAGAFAAPLAVEAQQPGKVWRIGVLSFTSFPGEEGRRIEAFKRGLGELGYVEGRNVTIESRSSDGKNERLPALAAELVRSRVDVIATYGTRSTQAAQQATSNLPIVMLTVLDPIGAGFVASLAHPGGNITGLSELSLDLSAKRLELLKEAVPRASTVAVLVDPGHPTNALELKNTDSAARRLGLATVAVNVPASRRFEEAFSNIARSRANALIVLPGDVVDTHRASILDLALKNRLPTLYGWKLGPESGALMSYGVDIADNFHQAAAYVDKILKGAKPGDIPVGQPTKFELVINLKTAKALGLTIPPSLLARADQVIE
jgi:putative tryptophan/tyrosine transport system substrate-binding protein